MDFLEQSTARLHQLRIMLQQNSYVPALVLFSFMVLIYALFHQVTKRRSNDKRKKVIEKKNSLTTTNGDKAIEDLNLKVTPVKRIERNGQTIDQESFTSTPQSIPSTPVSNSFLNGSPNTSKSPILTPLKTGILKKRNILSSSFNTFELRKEDSQQFVIYYHPSTQGATPSASKKSKFFYIGKESHIQHTSPKSFIIHQLASKEGLKLNLEARTPEEKQEWVERIEQALQELKNPSIS